ncbi:hypothetical protein QT996_28265 [Microcoleus sp. S13C4]
MSIKGIPQPPRAFHLSPYSHRSRNRADSKVFASKTALSLRVQTLPKSTNGVTCKTPCLSSVRLHRISQLGWALLNQGMMNL